MALPKHTLLAGSFLQATVPTRQRRTLAVILATSLAKSRVGAVTVLAGLNIVVAAGRLTGALQRITGHEAR
jgi:hypothetical protein